MEHALIIQRPRPARMEVAYKVSPPKAIIENIKAQTVVNGEEWKERSEGGKEGRREGRERRKGGREGRRVGG